MNVLCYALLLMLAPVVVIQQASPEPADYRLLIDGQPIAQGTVWLYDYGWGYLHRTELGTIQQGAVRIGLQAETLNYINDGTRSLTRQEFHDLVENGRVDIKLPVGT